MAVSPTGEAIALGNVNGTVDIVDLQYGWTSAQLTGLAGGPVQVRWLDDTQLLASTAAVTVEYDRTDDTPLAERLEVGTTNLVPSANDTLLYVDFGTATLRDLDARLEAGETAVPLDFPPGYIGGDLAVSPDGGTVAVFGVSSFDPANGSTGHPVIVLIDRSTGALRRVNVLGETGVDGGAPLAFSPDGRQLAFAPSSIGAVRILDVDTGRVGDPVGEPPRFLAWTTDGRALLVGTFWGEIRLIDPDTGEVLSWQRLSPDVELTGLVFLPDGSSLAVASASGEIFFLDSEDLTPVGEPLSAGSVPLTSLAVSDDGATLAATGEDGTLWLWDVSTRRLLGPPLGSNAGRIEGLLFGADGRRLFSSGMDGVYVWELSPDAWVDTACRLAGRDLTQAECQDYLPDQPYRGTCSDA